MTKKKSRFNHFSTSLIIILIAFVALFGWYSVNRHNADQKITKTDSKFTKAGTGPRPCLGNTEDSCVFAPSVDLYPNGIDGPGSNPELRTQSDDMEKEIGGIISAHSGKSITIKTTSGILFDITFPIDAISAWNNQNKDANYIISVGDTVALYYAEPANLHSHAISSSQIKESVLAIHESKSEDKIERYR